MSNMPTLQTLVDWSNIGVVISLALSFVFGGASIFLGSRLGKIKDAEAATAQQSLEMAVAAQQERAAKAERELAEVKRLQLPRSIPINLRPRLIEHLKPFAGQVIRAMEPNAADMDSSQFAQQIESLVTEAGWKYVVVSRSGNTILVGGPGRVTQQHGLICAVPNPHALTPAATALVNVLMAAGAKISLSKAEGETDPAIIGLVIGLKPIE